MLAKRKSDGVEFPVEKFKDMGNRVYYSVAGIDNYKAKEFHKLFKIEK